MKRAKTRDIQTNKVIQELSDIFADAIHDKLIVEHEYKNEIDIYFMANQALEEALLLRRLDENE